jgi:hypothetical protein
VNVEPLRPQFHKLHPAIHHQLAKLHHERKGILLPKSLVKGWTPLHLNPSHIVLKVEDTKGRVCMDPRASGLSTRKSEHLVVASTAMAALNSGETQISKFDISAAFTQFKLSWEAADLVFIPLVGMFGFSSLLRFNWESCEGMELSVLADLARQQNKSPVLRCPDTPD